MTTRQPNFAPARKRHAPKPDSPANALRKRQARERWAFYADLGTLRLAEVRLRAIRARYAGVTRPTCYEIDPKLEDAITQAMTAIAKVYARLLDSHRNDWKKTP